MNRANNKCPRRKKIADETLKIAGDGFYHNQAGQRVDLEVQPCLSETKLFSSSGLDTINKGLAVRPHKFRSTPIYVIEETTLAGAERNCEGRSARVGVLNFASAKHPGGGFLRGAQAQEESLARSSALYPSLSLKRCRPFYVSGRARPTYSDQIIYSPRCPVFRRDDGTLLNSPYYVDFITCAAPNAGACKVPDPKLLQGIFERRINYVLTLAAHADWDVVILGAWGCGVFRNDPHMVAEVFRECLSAFDGWFSNVVFSVLGRPTYDIFKGALI